MLFVRSASRGAQRCPRSSNHRPRFHRMGGLQGPPGRGRSEVLPNSLRPQLRALHLLLHQRALGLGVLRCGGWQGRSSSRAVLRGHDVLWPHLCLCHLLPGSVRLAPQRHREVWALPQAHHQASGRASPCVRRLGGCYVDLDESLPLHHGRDRRCRACRLDFHKSSCQHRCGGVRAVGRRRSLLVAELSRLRIGRGGGRDRHGRAGTRSALGPSMLPALLLLPGSLPPLRASEPPRGLPQGSRIRGWMLRRAVGAKRHSIEGLGGGLQPRGGPGLEAAEAVRGRQHRRTEAQGEPPGAAGEERSCAEQLAEAAGSHGRKIEPLRSTIPGVGSKFQSQRGAKLGKKPLTGSTS
mmetsp:Transcript_9549/g.20775  ORF Transcript_9549/g.20775 Transcript_9549/m.20775 type:complete len:352 (+) Transcript_9549:728-1783(+)